MFFQARDLVTVLSQDIGVCKDGDIRSGALVLRYGGGDYFEIDVVAESGIVTTFGIDAGKAQLLAEKLHDATDLYTEWEPEDYEHLKASWISDNPISTPEAYTEAMKDIARKCGV